MTRRPRVRAGLRGAGRFNPVRLLRGAVTAQPVLRNLVSNAASLAGATLGTSALGLAYWFVAARMFDPAAVGVGSAAVSGRARVASLSSLGLATYVMGDAQRLPGQRRSAVATTLFASGVSTAVVALAYVLAVPVVSPELRSLTSSPWVVLLFVVGTTATAIGMVLDSALLGALHGNVQLYRNMVFGVLKLVLLVAAGWLALGGGGLTLFGTWVVGLVLSLAGLAVLRRGWTRALLAELRLSAVVVFLRDVAPPVLRHQVLNLGLRAPPLVLPVIVITAVSAQANANFYIAWQVMMAAFVLPGSLATMLYAVGAEDTEALAQRLRSTLLLSATLTVAATVLLAGGARWILSVFGAQYAANGTATLVVLALAGIPTLVKNLYVAVCRVTRRTAAAVPLVYVGGALELILPLLGGRQWGLLGLSLGWLLAVVLEAVLMLPLLVRALRGTVVVTSSGR